MNVEIDPKYKRELEQLAEATGRTMAEVLEEVIQAGLSRTVINEDVSVAAKWKPKLLRFLDKMEALPMEGPDDEFSGENHEDVLNPRESCRWRSRHEALVL